MNMKLKSTNPAKNYEVIGEVDISTEAEIKFKVKKAHLAKKKWKETSIKNRIDFFRNLLSVYKKRSKEVAELQTKEMGKPISRSLEDTLFDIENVKYKLKIAEDCLSPKVMDENESQKNVLYYEPHGVAAVIVPWNYPSSNFFISCTQLLLAGNVIVFKHSEECPLTGKLLEEIMMEAGFPEGVFSEVYGGGKVGDILTNQDIDTIHFTGSSKVGQLLYKKAAEKFIPAVLEMGGSSPGIIFKDADLDKACAHASGERFENSGQVCCALKRLIVHESVYDEVVCKMKKNIASFRVGDPMDKNTSMGPLVAKRQLDLLVKQVEDAKSKGAKVITDRSLDKNLQGAFHQPVLVTNVSLDMKIMTEETFGPVLPIVTFRNEKEAIKLANKTIYGLSAYVYGKDLKKMKKAASQIDAGQISINGTSYFSDNSPFGGYKMSGIGRNDGKLGFYEATQKKVVSEPVQ